MGESQSIVINGKRYTKTTSIAPRAMDLQRRAPTNSVSAKQAPRNTSRTNTSTAQKATTVHQKTHSPSKRTATATTKHIRTLRTAPKQPVTTKVHHAPMGRVLGQQTRSQRMERAIRQKKSTDITKFGFQPKLQEEPVVEIPEVPSMAPAPAVVVPKFARQSVQAHIASNHRRAAPKLADALPAEPANKKEKRQFFSKNTMNTFASLSACAVLLFSYLAYLNIPNLNLRIAASKAGIDAQLPGYNPGGFHLNGPIAYSDGQLVLNFSSRVDERAYKLIQTKSAWDSKSLAVNYLDQSNQEYRTIEDRGLTIYLFNGSNATWVNSGIWYTVQGDGSFLSDVELVNIAASI